MYVLIEPFSDILVMAPLVTARCRDRNCSTPQFRKREQPAMLANGREIPPVGKVKQAVDAFELFFRHRVADPPIGAATIVRRRAKVCRTAR